MLPFKIHSSLSRNIDANGLYSCNVLLAVQDGASWAFMVPGKNEGELRKESPMAQALWRVV